MNTTAYDQLRNMAVQATTPMVIDAKTEEVAKMLCREERYAPDSPVSIKNGGFIPAWAMFIGAAIDLVRQYERLDFITNSGNKK